MSTQSTKMLRNVISNNAPEHLPWGKGAADSLQLGCGPF